MRRALVFAIATIVCILQASPAHAGGYGLSGQLWVEGVGTYMPNGALGAPSFDVSNVSTSARAVVNGTTPPFGFAEGYFGVRSGLDFTASDRWIIPLIDVGVYGILGVYEDTLTSVDGSLVKLHPAGSFMLDAEFLGFGVRFKKRRWMFEATIKPGVALMMMPAAIADGRTFTSIDPLTSATFTLRAQLSACRRLDPTERVCASVTPNIYQWGWGNGGSLSLRWEFGP